MDNQNEVDLNTTGAKIAVYSLALVFLGLYVAGVSFVGQQLWNFFVIEINHASWQISFKAAVLAFFLLIVIRGGAAMDVPSLKTQKVSKPTEDGK